MQVSAETMWHKLGKYGLQNSTRIISHVACALDYIFDIRAILGFPRHVITIMNRLRWVDLGI